MPQSYILYYYFSGFERFSKYQGFSDSFKYEGDYTDGTPIDQESLHRKSKLVAIDALNLGSNVPNGEQYRRRKILRELNKAYVGFSCEE